MTDITKQPYSQWLETSLQEISKLNIDSICILAKDANGNISTGYFDCDVADKLLFAGFLNQDAMIETLQQNGYIEDDDEEEEVIDDEFDD